MKKVFLVFLLICGIAANSRAQYVTIPDSLFAHILDSVLIPCMNGNQLDTTCPDLLNKTYFQDIVTGIKDLTGIQYFKNLITLRSSTDTALVSIPKLPPNLRYVSFSFTHLGSLPTLPSGLYSLYCRDCRLDSLPILPDSLIVLECPDNRLLALPTLPAHLSGLNCGGNMLNTLPTLPGSLQRLACDANRLTVLPILSVSLQSLSCTANRLTSLPALPVGLRRFYCSNNQISSLPALPSYLIELYCDHNQLTSLPPLPDYLDDFYCGYNYNLSCLPELGRIGEFRWDSTDIRCLPDTTGIFGSSVPPLSSVPLCRYSNPYGCLATAIEDLAFYSFTLSPNPATTTLYSSISLHDIDLTITDITGRLCAAPHTDREINISALPAGVYWLRLQGRDGSVVRRFVRE